MKEQESAHYWHRDDSEEVFETGESAIRYIFTGDSLHEIYEPTGLLVFAIITALRETDDHLHGDAADLSEAQEARLKEVEDEVDRAVGSSMHYYPWGDKQNKRVLPKQDVHQLTTGERAHFGAQIPGSAAHKRGIRKSSIRAVRIKKEKPEKLSGPVTTQTPEQTQD